MASRNKSFLCFFLLACISLQHGCTLQDVSQDSDDRNFSSNKNIETTNAADNFANDPVALAPLLAKLSAEIQSTLQAKENADFDRLKTIIHDSFQEQKTEGRKFQFLCDENERWIYRCNLITGEIECFSMSSNKLRLLSSIK